MSLLLAVLITVILIFGFASAPRDARGSRTVLSTYVMVLLGFGLYVAFPAWLVIAAGKYTWASRYYSEEQFSVTLGVCLAALLTFIYGNSLSRARGRQRRLAESTPELPLSADLEGSGQRPWRTAPQWVLLALVLIGTAMKVDLVLAGGGLEQSVIRLSSYASDVAGVDDLEASAIGIRTLSGLADGAATWGLVQALRDRRRVGLWTLCFAVVLTLSYFTIGKRLLILLPIVCVVLAFDRYVRPITVRVVPLVFVGMVGLGLLTLFARIFVPAAVAGVAIDLRSISYADGSALSFYLYSLEFSTVEMISVAIREGPSIAGMFGGSLGAFMTTNLTPFLYSVPSFLWPGKPEVFYDLSYGVSAALGDSAFQDPTVGYATTLIGTSFILAGILGVLLTMAALGLVVGLTDRALLAKSWAVGRVIIFALALVFAFHFFRQGTLGWAFIVSIVQQYGFLLGVALAGVSCLMFGPGKPGGDRRPNRSATLRIRVER